MITTNQAAIWAMMAIMGARGKLPGLGRCWRRRRQPDQQVIRVHTGSGSERQIPHRTNKSIRRGNHRDKRDGALGQYWEYPA